MRTKNSPLVNWGGVPQLVGLVIQRVNHCGFYLNTTDFIPASIRNACFILAETAVVDPNALVQIILERSQLARELKAVWHGCNEGGVVHLLINNWLHLSLSVSTSVSHRLPQLPIRFVTQIDCFSIILRCFCIFFFSVQ